MHVIFLCLRFLHKRRIAFFGTAAVALCVALLIVITSLFTGFIQAYRNYWQSYYGDFMFMPNISLSQPNDLADALESIEGIQNAMPVVDHGGLLYLGKGNVRAVELIGVDFGRWLRQNNKPGAILSVWPDAGELTTELPPAIIDRAEAWHLERFGRAMLPEERPIPALVGIGILARPDEITDQYPIEQLLSDLRNLDGPLPVISGTVQKDGSDNTMSGYKRINRLCWPVAIVQTGTVEIDNNKIYLPFQAVSDMVDTAGTGNVRFHITCDPMRSKDELEHLLFRAWKQFAIEKLGVSEFAANGASIEQTANNYSLVVFTREIRKQLYIMQIILSFICMVAALLVFVIIMMIVMQKKRDIGIVRALGSSRRSIALLFIFYGGGIGLAGSVLGVILGIWATWKIDVLESLVSRILGFKIWVTDVYLFSHIPNQVDWSSLIWIVVAGVLTATLGALLPAWRAARLQPVESLRYE